MNAATFLAAASTVSLAGCASSDAAMSAHLPFRVAVAPVRIIYADGPQDASPPGLLLHVDGDALGRRIRDELRGGVFADARLVHPPEPDTEDGSEADETGLVRAAAAIGANLILECDVQITPTVVTEKNDRFWPNLLLFLIGGPASWFVRDRSYYFDAQLSAHLHQIEPLLEGTAALGDGRARLTYAHAVVQEVALDLIDRSDAAPLPLLASILVPAGFLIPEGGSVAGSLEQEVTARLAAELARQLGESRQQIVEGGLVTEIGFEGGSCRRQPDGLWLSGTALLRAGAATRLAGFSVQWGGETIAGTFDAPPQHEPSAGGKHDTLRYPLAVKLPDRAEDEIVELHLFAGGRDRSQRSFCVPLRWASGR